MDYSYLFIEKESEATFQKTVIYIPPGFVTILVHANVKMGIHEKLQLRFIVCQKKSQGIFTFPKGAVMRQQVDV